MTPGCGLFKSGEPVQLQFPAVIDYAHVRCPEIDATTKNEWRRSTPRPKHWSEEGATSGELMGHIDKLEIAEARKNGYGANQSAEYERCRRGDNSPAPSS